MNVEELINVLSEVEDKSVPVYVENGLDPSDPEEAVRVEPYTPRWVAEVPGIRIS